MSALLSIFPASLSLVSRAVSLILSQASDVFSFVLSHAPDVLSLVLSQASDVFSLTVSLASTALSLTVLSVSAATAGRVLQASPIAAATAMLARLCMACPPRRCVLQKRHQRRAIRPGGSALQELLGNLFHIGGIDLSLVGFHDITHEATDLFEVGDAQGFRTLLHEAPQRGGVETLGKEALAELDLESQ